MAKKLTIDDIYSVIAEKGLMDVAADTINTPPKPRITLDDVYKITGTNPNVVDVEQQYTFPGSMYNLMDQWESEKTPEQRYAEDEAKRRSEEFKSQPSYKRFGQNAEASSRTMWGGLKYGAARLYEKLGWDEWAQREYGYADQLISGAPYVEQNGIIDMIGAGVPMLGGFGIAAALAPLTGGTSLAPLAGVFSTSQLALLGGSAYGNALMSSDEYEKEAGIQIPEWHKQGVAIGAAATEFAFEYLRYFKTFLPKQLTGKFVTAKLLSNPKLSGRILNDFAKKYPSVYKQIGRTGVKMTKQAAWETVEEPTNQWAQSVLDNTYKLPEDKMTAGEIGSAMWDAGKQAFVTGFFLFGGTQQLSQSMMNRMSRKANGINLVTTNDGDVLEVVGVDAKSGKVVGMNSWGETIEISKDDIVDNVKVSQEDLSMYLKVYEKEGKNWEEIEREIYRKDLDAKIESTNIRNKQSGDVVGAVDRKGNFWYILDQAGDKGILAVRANTKDVNTGEDLKVIIGVDGKVVPEMISEKELTVTGNIQYDTWKNDFIESSIEKMFTERQNQDTAEKAANEVVAEEKIKGDKEYAKGDQVSYKGENYIVDQTTPDNIIAYPENGDPLINAVEIPISELNAPIVPVDGETSIEDIPQEKSFRLGNTELTYYEKPDGSSFIPIKEGVNVDKMTEIVNNEVDTDQFDVVPVTQEIPIENAPPWAKKKSEIVTTGISIVPKGIVQPEVDMEVLPEELAVDQENIQEVKKEITPLDTALEVFKDSQSLEDFKNQISPEEWTAFEDKYNPGKGLTEQQAYERAMDEIMGEPVKEGKLTEIDKTKYVKENKKWVDDESKYLPFEIDVADLETRSKMAGDIIDWLDNLPLVTGKVDIDDAQADGSKGRFNNTNVANFIGDENSTINNQEDVERIRDLVEQFKTAIDNEISERKSNPDVEGKFVYGRKAYESYDELLKDLRTLDPHRLPISYDYHIMKALDYIKNEKPKEGEKTTEKPKEEIKQESPEKISSEKTKNLHNSLIQRIREYNSIPRSYNKKRADAYKAISNMSMQLGYTLGQRNRKLVALDKGKVIKTIAERQDKETVQLHPGLNDYPSNVRDFINATIETSPDLIGIYMPHIPSSERIRALRDINEGKKSVAANNVLDELEKMFNNGGITCYDKILGKVFITIDEVLSERDELIANKKSDELNNYSYLDYEIAYEKGLITKEERDEIKQYIEELIESEREAEAYFFTESYGDNERSQEEGREEQSGTEVTPQKRSIKELESLDPSEMTFDEFLRLKGAQGEYNGSQSEKDNYEKKYNSLVGKPKKEAEDLNNLIDKKIESKEDDINLANEKVGKYTTQDGKGVQYTLSFGDEISDIDTSKRNLQRQADREQNPSLRRLKEGEFAYVERKYTAQKSFSFTGKDKIETYDDVAYIFKNLEKASIENSFYLIVKNGKPIAFHTGMGTFAGVVANMEMLHDIVTRFNPEAVYFVHNHPSGNLKPSNADVQLLRKIKSIYPKLLKDGVILDVNSGNYGVFNIEGESTITERADQNETRKVKILKFDKQIINKPVNRLAKITSSSDIAQFLTSQRLGIRNKLSYVVLSRNNNITANIHCDIGDPADLTDKDIKEISSTIIRFGGSGVIFYGRFPHHRQNDSRLMSIKRLFKDNEIILLDIINIKSKPEIDITVEGTSYSDEGIIQEPENFYSKQKTKGVDKVNDEEIKFRYNTVLHGIDGRSPLGLYSTVQKAIDGLKQAKGTPQQMKAMLLKNGAKQAEMDWMEFDKFIQDKKSLTKEEIQEWFDSRKIEVREVVKGKVGREDLEMVKVEPFIYNVVNKQGDVVLERVSEQRAIDFIENNYDGTDTKFSQWQSPGGENYREVLLTMPVDNKLISEGSGNVVFKGTEQQAKEWLMENVSQESMQYYTLNRGEVFKSDHFEEPNIVAHVRMNDRITKDGEKILFLEEVQSDWAQKGKREGFAEKEDQRIPVNSIKEEHDYEQKGYFIETDMNVNPPQSYAVKKAGKGVLNMPFKKTDQWLGLAMKRMLIYAAENGYDGIGWTTGEQQAERYDLSKQVDKISATKTGEFYMLDIIKNGDVIAQEMSEAKNLPELVGKDLAEKIIDDINEGNDEVSYSGIDLKVGGEGMKAFYDQIIPSWVNKNLKKYGVQAGETQIDLKPDITPEGINLSTGEVEQSMDGKYTKVHFTPITDQIREVVPQGMPMFRLIGSPISKPKTAGELLNRHGLSNKQIKTIGNKLRILALKTNARVNIIDRQSQLPKSLQKHIGDQQVPGIFSGGTSYIILENIISETEAIKTFLHEIGVHKGITNILPNYNDRVEFFNKVFDDIGLEEIQKIVSPEAMKEYKNKKISKHILGEEYMAYLAEKKLDPNKVLTKKEQTLWEKFIAKVKEVFDKIFNFDTKITEQDVLDIAKEAIQSNFQERRPDTTIGRTVHKDIPQQRLSPDNYPQRPDRPGIRFAGELLNQPMSKKSTRFDKETLFQLKEIENRYNSLGENTGTRVTFDQTEDGKTFATAEEINPHFKTIAEYLKEAFKGIGYEYANTTVAKSGTIYVYRDGIGSGLNIRISDHTGRGGVFTPTHNISSLEEAKRIINETPTKQELDQKNEEAKKIRENEFNKRKEFTNNLASEGLQYKILPRTYQSPEVFKAKHPEAISVKITELGKSKYGEMAYKYEYLAPYDSKKDGYLNNASDEYTEWFNQQKDISIQKFEKSEAGSEDTDIRFRHLTNDDESLRKELEANKEDRKKLLNLIDEVRKKLSDRDVAMEKFQKELVEKHGGKVTDESNVALKLNLYNSRKQAKQEEFNKKHLDPFIETLKTVRKTAKVTFDDVNIYMRAKHAPERNANIIQKERDRIEEVYQDRAAQVSPKDPDYEVKANKLIAERNKKLADFEKQIAKDDNFSGFSTEKANEIVNKLESKLDKKLIDTFWKQLNAMSNYHLDQLLDGGLISKQLYDKLKAQYQYYVPLKGWDREGEPEFDYVQDISTILSSPIKGAQGRKSMSDDPLPYIVNAAYSAIVQNEKARIAKAASLLISQNKEIFEKNNLGGIRKTFVVQLGYNPDGSVKEVEFDQPPPQEYFDAGKVRTKNNTPFPYEVQRSKYEAKAHEVVAYANGEKYIIWFSKDDPAVANAINRKIPAGIEASNAAFQKFPGIITRFMAGNFTVRSLNFVFGNLMRDLPLSMVSNFVDHGFKGGAQFLYQTINIQPTLRREMQGKLDPNNKMDKYMMEFNEGGGRTGYSYLQDIKAIEKNIKRTLRIEQFLDKSGYARIPITALPKLIKGIETLAGWSEDISRFATYVVEREQGSSHMEALKAAKNVSVNFDKKGELSGTLGSFYAFFNATIRAVVKYGQMWEKAPYKMGGTHLFLMAQGFLIARLMDMFGGMDDDDEEKKYDNLSDYKKYFYLNIPIVNISIPMPHILRVPHSFGVAAYDVWSGRKKMGEAMKTVAGMSLGEFSPIDPQDFINRQGEMSLMPISPTAFRPVFELMANQNFMGLPIYKEMYTPKLELETADAAKHFKRVGPGFKAFTKNWYMIGGGNEHMDKFIWKDGKNKKVREFWDWNPAKIEHLYNSYLGGPAKLFNQTAKMAEMTIDAANMFIEDKDLQKALNEFDSRHMPVIYQFRVNTYGSALERYWYDQLETMGVYESNLKKAAKRGDYQAYGEMISSPLHEKYEQYLATKEMIDVFREMMSMVDQTSEEFKDYEKRMRDVMKTYKKNAELLESEINNMK